MAAPPLQRRSPQVPESASRPPARSAFWTGNCCLPTVVRCLVFWYEYSESHPVHHILDTLMGSTLGSSRRGTQRAGFPGSSPRTDPANTAPPSKWRSAYQRSRLHALHPYLQPHTTGRNGPTAGRRATPSTPAVRTGEAADVSHGDTPTDCTGEWTARRQQATGRRP